MKNLHLIIVHASKLTFRESFMKTTQKIMEDAAKARGWRVHKTFVFEHETEQLKTQFQEIEKIIDYCKIGDEEFDRFLQTLSIEQISNFFKQREALEKVVRLSKKEVDGEENLYLILEDDAMILPEFKPNFEAFIGNPRMKEWDMLLLCASLPSQVSNYDLYDVRKLFKILPSKEAYCIKPDIAEKVLTSMRKITYPYRVQLSRWIDTNSSVRVMCPTVRVSIEGSKVGFIPSSVSENNILIYNNEFMELFKMVIGQSPMDLQKARQIYKIVEHLKSPEIMHLYGVILFKNEKKEQAKEIFLAAVNESIQKNGCISARSELLNNAINIHGIVQEDLEVHRKYPSKYANVNFEEQV